MEGICEATQIASCEFYQMMIQATRENYPVTTGIMPWVFKRSWTTAGIQLVDGLCEPIAPYYYMKNAYRNVCVSLCLKNLSFYPEETVFLPVKILNEYNINLDNSKITLSVFSPEMEKVCNQIQAVSEKTDYEMEPFKIPQEYTDKFFFILVSLTQEDKELSRSVYWTKCLSLLSDRETLAKCRGSAEPNFRFDNGPWLKPQIALGKKAKLTCKVQSVKQTEDIITIGLSIKNTSDIPAFPVHIGIENDKTLCVCDDNFFWQGARETRNMELTVWNKNSQLKELELTVSAWNSKKITTIIKLDEQAAAHG